MILVSFCTLDLQRECYGYNKFCQILHGILYDRFQDDVVDSFYIEVCKLGEFQDSWRCCQMLHGILYDRFQDFIIVDSF